MSVYKKLTAQDYSVVPFNAHKQYNFVSQSAASNKITFFTASWSKESIDLYNSGSVKYNQIDHLFYKNFQRDISNRFGNVDYLNQKRTLYEDSAIISIPAGLYGHEIKPGSFYLSSSVNGILVDDTYGNLIVSGTNLDNYITDPRKNLLNIGPVKGFKKYDLNTIDGYLSFNGYDNSLFYRDGKPRVNNISSYSTPDFGDEFDDSYYNNIIKYKNINFTKQALFDGIFPGVRFNGSTSEIQVGHSEKFNFNKGDDFSISFNMLISQSSTDTSYLISKSTTKTVIPTPNEGKAGRFKTSTSGALQPKDTFAEPQFPFEVYATGNTIFFERFDGNVRTTVSSSFTGNVLQHVTCRVTSSAMGIFINGESSGTHKTDTSTDQTQNTANIYIGSKGGNTNFLSGSMSQINIFEGPLSNDQIESHYSSSNNSPYVGNVFYQNGFAITTHPAHKYPLEAPKLIQKKLTSAIGAATGSSVSDVLFNDDGTRMYIMASINGDPSISQFNLSTTYDISTATFHVSKSFSQGFSSVGGHFNNDGSAIFVVDTSGEKIRKFNVTTPFDISGGIPYASQITPVPGFSLVVQSPWDIDFNPDGSKMYVSEQGAGDKIYEFDLTTPFDVSTVTLNTELDLNTNFGIATSFQGKGIIVDQEGTRLLVSDDGNNTIYEFFLNTPYRIQSAVLIRSYPKGSNLTGLFTVGNKIFTGNTNKIEELEITSDDIFKGDMKINFQGSHLIYENEYQCTIDEHEFNDTLNISARKIKSNQSQDPADFTTGSLFKPYVTTIGLYNENNELLVVGKLGQPIRTSNETDTTFIVRWDT